MKTTKNNNTVSETTSRNEEIAKMAAGIAASVTEKAKKVTVAALAGGVQAPVKEATVIINKAPVAVVKGKKVVKTEAPAKTDDIFAKVDARISKITALLEEVSALIHKVPATKVSAPAKTEKATKAPKATESKVQRTELGGKLGSVCAKIELALLKGTTLEKLEKLSGWSKSLINAHIRMLTDKRGHTLNQDAEAMIMVPAKA